ncbi:LOW QUALITY PROTEIN: hypothetical protein PHMEG_00037998 [Phytophthora megakarya]|uniref:Uncharacterized protein n=1 Tax=Phytophthora megakarya TaxID=4795 RepID=A0A225UIM8_9STRA|nr:LOW QUALITY PROTEIN: hypothetical protein PHMEG_00037998 [Phytophthora megakarya]
MKNYHEWMGGVDIHDQLHELAGVSPTQYSADPNSELLMPSSFTAQKLRGEPPADHAGFLTVLPSQLLQTSKADYVEEILSPGSTMLFCGSDQHADELAGVSPTQYSADPNSELLMPSSFTVRPKSYVGSPQQTMQDS